MSSGREAAVAWVSRSPACPPPLPWRAQRNRRGGVQPPRPPSSGRRLPRSRPRTSSSRSRLSDRATRPGSSGLDGTAGESRQACPSAAVTWRGRRAAPSPSAAEREPVAALGHRGTASRSAPPAPRCGRAVTSRRGCRTAPAAKNSSERAGGSARRPPARLGSRSLRSRRRMRYSAPQPSPAREEQAEGDKDDRHGWHKNNGLLDPPNPDFLDSAIAV